MHIIIIFQTNPRNSLKHETAEEQLVSVLYFSFEFQITVDKHRQNISSVFHRYCLIRFWLNTDAGHNVSRSVIYIDLDLISVLLHLRLIAVLEWAF